MTAFVVNAGGTVEWDSLTGGSTNATLDSYAISNKTTLRIACDSYACANHSAAFGSVDTVTFSGTGGKLQVDGTRVRVIPYNTGSGNVPAVGTNIVQGAIRGPLLGVWSGWQVEPTAVGAAMPATGFIKIKSMVVFDAADRANGAIGAGYTACGVDGGLDIFGNEIKGTSGQARASLRTAETYQANQYVKFKLGALTTSCAVSGIVRGVGAGATLDCYYGSIFFGSSWSIARSDDGTTVTLASGTFAGEAIGDVIEVRAVDGTISLYRNSVLLGSAADSTYASGSPGLDTYSDAEIDDAEFGNVGGNSGAFAAGALTGIGATATGADVTGWIEVRGADTASITVPRIGAFEVIGDWFVLGTTTGARGQVLACPTTATVAGVFPGVWIETAAGSNVYERFAGVGSMVNAATTPTDERGKIVWQTTGGIRIGSDGTNNVGFLPPTGCRVRIPNVILTCCTRTAGGSGIRVLPNATLATRQEFVTTAAGDIDISHAVFQWYGNFLQAFRADVANSAVSGTLILQEIASPIAVDNVIVAPTQTQLNFALNMVSCFGGGTFQNALLARFSLAASGAYVNTCNFNKGITFSSVKSQTLLTRGNATTGVWTATQNVDCTWTGCTNIGGRALHVGAQRPVFTNCHYADQFSGTTTATLPMYAFEFTTGCVSPKVDGLDFLGLTNLHPYAGIASAAACYDVKLRNIGTYASPLNLGSANASGLIFNGAGNNDGIAIQRVYVSNTRTGPWAFVNSDNNVLLADVKADYADTSVIASLNTLSKAVSLLGATTGQVSVYGTHWKDSFRSATVGAIEILCNEPTTASATQCVVTAGTPQFNSNGQVSLAVIGDQVTWEMPHFALGHTALANLAITLTGTNTGNLTYEFQADKGAGYGGSWLTLNAANLTAQGAIDPAIGVRLKVRATCATANAGNLLTNIAIPTVTTSVAQGGNPYPLEIVTVTFTGLPTGCDVVILLAGTSTILQQTDSHPSVTYAYAYSGTPTVDVGFIKPGFVPLYLRALALGASDASIPVTLTPDRNYS